MLFSPLTLFLQIFTTFLRAQIKYNNLLVLGGFKIYIALLNFIGLFYILWTKFRYSSLLFYKIWLTIFTYVNEAFKEFLQLSAAQYSVWKYLFNYIYIYMCVYRDISGLLHIQLYTATFINIQEIPHNYQTQLLTTLIANYSH